MKRLLCAVSVLAFLAPSAALSQQQGDRNRPGSGQHARPAIGGGHGHARPPGQRPTMPNRPGRPSAGDRPTIQPVPNRPAPHRPGRPGAGERPTIQPVPNRPGRPGVRPPHFRPIHRPPFRWPHGYRYQRWNIGLLLPHIFLSNAYWFNDWRMVGAYPPPPGFVWVRYGPDLLLVDRYTGRIRDVIYGAFY